MLLEAELGAELAETDEEMDPDVALEDAPLELNAELVVAAPPLPLPPPQLVVARIVKPAKATDVALPCSVDSSTSKSVVIGSEFCRDTLAGASTILACQTRKLRIVGDLSIGRTNRLCRIVFTQIL